MEQPGQQQGQLQEQVAQLIGSLPGLLAGESEESLDDAVAAVSRLPVGVCAGLLQLPEPARRRAVLRHARGGAAAAAPEVASTAEAITRLETQLTVLVRTTAAAAQQQQQLMQQVIQQQQVVQQTVQLLVSDRLCPKASSSTQLRNRDCREQVISYYYPEGPPPKLRCMLQEEELDGKEVVAAHIYQLHWGQTIADHVGLDINGPRNLLLLAKAAGKRFCELRWTLKPLAPSLGTGPEGQLRPEQTFKVLVLDPALLEPSSNKMRIADHASPTKTWSSVHGKLLVFAEGQAMPYRQACALHASRALQYAAGQGWAGHLSEEDKLVEKAAYAASPPFDAARLEQFLDNAVAASGVAEGSDGEGSLPEFE